MALIGYLTTFSTMILQTRTEKKTFTSKKLHITFVNNNLLCVPNCYFLPAKSNVLVYRRFDLLREVFIRTEFRFVTCCRLLPLFRL